MNLDKNIDKILETIQNKYGNSSDLVSRKIKIIKKKYYISI